MKNDLYRKPTTSPIQEVHVLFDAAKDKGIKTSELADLTGYSMDMLAHMRRPSANGQGRNPPYQVLKDLADLLGYEFRLVPRGDNA